MAPRTDSFDLGALRLSTGEGRCLELMVSIDAFELSGERYDVMPGEVAVRLDISRTTGSGYALRLRFRAGLSGACMRCLEHAQPQFEIDSREVSLPDSGEDLSSPYVEGGVLDLRRWSRDALALALPASVLCRPDCAGLCAICGEDLNQAGPEHHHEAGPDPRWAKLAELRLE
ncbi:MAG: YceD family protein [Solirubrobacteraceae bacterium]